MDRRTLEQNAIDSAFATVIKGQFDILFAALLSMRGFDSETLEQLSADEYRRCLDGVHLARTVRETLMKICADGTE